MYRESRTLVFVLFGSLGLLVCQVQADVFISEMLINASSVTTSADQDQEFVEIKSDTGAAESLAGLTFLYIEGDLGGNSGMVDYQLDLGTLNLGTNGLAVLTDGVMAWDPAADSATAIHMTEFNNLDGGGDDLENGSATFLIVENYTGLPAADLDTDDDGVLDTTPWSNVVDAVGWIENAMTSTEFSYADQLGGLQFDGTAAGFDPDAFVRAPDGAFVMSTADNDTDLQGNGPYYIGTITAGVGTPTDQITDVAGTAGLVANTAFTLTPGSMNMINALGATTISGDFDGDGDYACADVDPLVAEIVAGTNTASFDLTGDGLVDGADLTAWLAEAGAAELASGNSYLLGDANLDGVVDVGDFNIWNGSKFSSTPAWCSGDFNADGVVDVGDFNIWNGNKFSAADVSAVPEPGTWVLSALGCLFLAMFRRKSRS